MTRPYAALRGSVGKEIVVTCKNDSECIGNLSEVDEYMNIVLYDGRACNEIGCIKNQFVLRGITISIIRLDVVGNGTR